MVFCILKWLRLFSEEEEEGETTNKQQLLKKSFHLNSKLSLKNNNNP